MKRGPQQRDADMFMPNAKRNRCDDYTPDFESFFYYINHIANKPYPQNSVSNITDIREYLNQSPYYREQLQQGNFLRHAAATQNLAVVRYLICTEKADATKADALNRTPLMLAAATGNKPLVEFLLNYSLPILNAVSIHNRTALNCALTSGNQDLIDMLVGLGAHYMIYDFKNHMHPEVADLQNISQSQQQSHNTL